MPINYKKYFIRKLPFEQRKEIIEEIAESSSPGFDFFLFVILSTSIATMGLITNSPAVIIGAMLVAPLMSPIIGIGLASIIGEDHLLRSGLSALLRGAILAVTLAALLTLVNSYLPFVTFQELTDEVVSRSHPSPLDLVVALAGGLAAAYSLTEPKLSAALPGVAIATAILPPLCAIGVGIALQRWDVAGGATLLFITNAITIAFASALVFFLRGFNPYKPGGNRGLPPSLKLSLVLIFLLLIPLSYYSVQFVRQANADRTINSVVQKIVKDLAHADLVELQINRLEKTLNLELTIRTNKLLRYEQVVALQAKIVEELAEPVSIRVHQYFAEQLDPLIPPTPTFTATVTNTVTPGPSPTATFTATFTATASATPSQTPSPTMTVTSTSTPALARAYLASFPLMRIYQYPGGPVIGLLSQNQVITVLPGERVFADLIWVQIIDQDNRNGWVPKIYINIFTATPEPLETMISVVP